MKRLTLLTAGIILLLACNKKGDYTCTCTSGSSITDKEVYKGVTYHTANKRCENLEAKYMITGTSQSLDYTQCGLY